MEREVDIWMENVRYLRKRYGLSKKEMAKILKIGIETLNKIERGELPKRASVEIIFRIEDYFGILAKDQFITIKERRL